MLELFIVPGDRGSEKVGVFVLDNYLDDLVTLRDASDPATAATFRARGGALLPALWTGEELISGAEAAMAYLQRFTNIGRAP